MRHARRRELTRTIRFDQLIDERAETAAANVALAYWAANKYAGAVPSLDEEARQSACIDGLCKAAKKWREERGVKFSTFATRCMLNEMIRENQKAGHMRVVSLTILIDEGFAPVTHDRDAGERMDQDAAMATLTRGERRLWTLAAVEGMSRRKLAEAYGVKPKRIAERLDAIRSKLAGMMEAD